MSASKLILHPEAAAVPPAETTLLALLQELGVVGAAFALDGATHYRTGPAFLDHLSFLGCAPAIELDPPRTGLEAAARAGHFCHIRISQTTPVPRLRIQPGRRPRCRSCCCDIPAENLAPLLAFCPRCGHSVPVGELNWRQAGGSARLFVEFWGIHTGEAVPGDQLLDRLGPGWHFFYTED